MKKKTGFFGVLIILVLVALLTWGSISVLLGYEHYRRVYQNPLTVTARVTNHDDRSDSESDSYCAQITYTVDGQTYSNVDYKTAGSKSALPGIGSQLQVQVSPEDPGKLLQKLGSGFGTVCILGLAFLTAGGISTLWQRGRTKGLMGTPDEDTVRRDVRLTICGRGTRYCWLLSALTVVGLCWRYPMLFGIPWRSAAVALGAAWVYCLYTTLRDVQKLDRGEYAVRRDVLDRKTEESDSDGTSYTFYYRSGEDTWKKHVTRKAFEAAREGDTVTAVYLAGAKKPVLHYDAEGDAC